MVSSSLSWSWFLVDPHSLPLTLWSGSLLRVMIQVEMLKRLVLRLWFRSWKKLCPCHFSIAAFMNKRGKACFVHVCFNAWKKKFTESFEILEKISKLKAVGWRSGSGDRHCVVWNFYQENYCQETVGAISSLLIIKSWCQNHAAFTASVEDLILSDVLGFLPFQSDVGSEGGDGWDTGRSA